MRAFLKSMCPYPDADNKSWTATTTKVLCWASVATAIGYVGFWGYKRYTHVPSTPAPTANTNSSEISAPISATEVALEVAITPDTQL